MLKKFFIIFFCLSCASFLLFGSFLNEDYLKNLASVPSFSSIFSEVKNAVNAVGVSFNSLKIDFNIATLVLLIYSLLLTIVNIAIIPIKVLIWLFKFFGALAPFVGG